MSLTVNAVENTLFAFLGGRMQMVGFSINPTTSEVPNLNTLQAINYAAEMLNIPVTIYGSPTDADLASVIAGQPTRIFVDLSKLGMLEQVVGNWDNNNGVLSSAVQDSSVSFTDNLKDMQSMIAMFYKQYAAYLNPNRGGVVAGRVVMPYPVAPRPGFRYGGNYGGYGGAGGYGWSGPRY